ncbi:MAG: dTDP-4-dehydrorhamnose reductase [Deltaproteobacteria bacterium]|nr:dTDP-4-dehydrorhamnose reductase [Deltaproteobacteria bacterium]MBN2688726.1 dTDP-4-dehydrorhamnose reductase [Deltaproteobacteria bacterium]
MRILVLGHRGMLGNDIVYRLGLVHDVIGMDIDECDITVPGECQRIVDETGPQVVVNAAAYTDVDGCEMNRQACFAVNADAVRNIALACRDRSIKVVHFSTDYVFSGMKGTPYKEDDECNPINVYGESKLAGERYLRNLTDNWIIVRTAWLYGKNGKNFVNTIVGKAKEESSLRVVNDQVGSPTYTVDVAAAVHALIDGDQQGLFHVTNRGRCSWYELTLKILEYANLTDVRVDPVSTDEFPRAAARPRYSVLNCSKFSDCVNRTLRFWQIALKDYINRII